MISFGSKKAILRKVCYAHFGVSCGRLNALNLHHNPDSGGYFHCECYTTVTRLAQRAKLSFTKS